MNNIRKCVIIDIKYLLKYKEFLLNKKYQLANKKAIQAKFCTICCDDCDGSCMNSNFTHISNISNINNINNIANINNISNNITLRMMTCSNNCNENVYNDCICL